MVLAGLSWRVVCTTVVFFAVATATHLPGSVLKDMKLQDPPNNSLQVRYNKPVTQGALLHKLDTASSPKIRLPEADSSSQYTVILSDPDAPRPTSPKAREWLHWLVTNIPGAELSASNGFVGRGGDVVVPYAGPSPPIGTHRYVVTVFKQKEAVEATKPHTRARFHTAEFASQYKLQLVSGTYFRVQSKSSTRRK
eukprot:TRINITY_DN62044_c0_g1_i1.p2 TRINITY_DN62044_c0_g1~~TRINITY_DN62044_c0_g1_i1.p2  ORF type:complete len:195 (-),score=18.50 TRINITY_DN62044_c0_g1_i1:1375-1959(-)